MNAINQIIIEGNVVKDSILKETPRGTKVCIVPIATNYMYKDSNGTLQNEVGYYDIEAWGQNFSSHIVKNATKGRGIRVVGRLKQDRWKNENGKQFSKVYICADHIEFKPPKRQEGTTSNDESHTNVAERLKNEHEMQFEELITEKSADVF